MSIKRIVRLKIDVTKIEKARLFQGAKALYLDATVFLDDDTGRYGDNGMITQDVSKEDRENGIKGAILGNATIFKILGDERERLPAKTAAPASNAPDEDPDSDPIPF